jgi:hypothetical protein
MPAAGVSSVDLRPVEQAAAAAAIALDKALQQQPWFWRGFKVLLGH